MFDFDKWCRKRVEAVDSFLEKRIDCGMRGAPAALREAMLYSLRAGGKRARSLLVYGASDAVGGRPKIATPAAAAVECIHTYSLIHDDLPAMDDDDLRRGKPTCHKVYGEALAILAGDALLTLAFQILGERYGDRKAARAAVTLAKGAGAAGMVGGQALDLIADGRITPGQGDRPPDDREFLRAIHRRKTGALFKASVMLGLDVAGPDWTRRAARCVTARNPLADYADAFGMAFQITDDLLDVQGDAATAGKAVNKDAGRGKLTYPGLLGIAASEAEAEGHSADGLAALAAAGFGAGALPLKHLLLALRNRKK